MFDSPTFIKKIMKKKSCSKYNIRPLYTADIVAEVGPWKNAATKVATTYSFSQQRKPKTYNQPSVAPSLTHSASTSTTLSDSAIHIPTNSIRKRPLSSEILIRIMDQRIMKKKQQLLKVASNENQLNRSASASTSTSTSPRLNKLLPTSSSSTTIRRKSLTRQTNISTSLGSSNLQKIKTSKSVLNKLNHHQTATQQLITEWPYVLTQDNDEQDRMVAQHYLLRTAFGSDFSSPIKPLLQKGIVVLDVGCGPGTWTMEMSTAFPKSTFIGIDQSAFYPRDIKPRNCHFRSCGSLVQHQLPLPFPDNSIDYIYQRDMNWGLTGQTWQPLLQEYQRILKPGGWIEFVEPVSYLFFFFYYLLF